MIFNTFSFLFVFLPCVLVLFYLPGLRRFRYITLTASSLVFYGISGIEHAVVLCLDVLWLYYFMTRENFQKNKILLFVTIIPPILALFYYKYIGFFFRSIFGIGNSEISEVFSVFDHIVLPAGISFFTFQAVSFAIDRYRGDIKEVPSFSRVFTFITFFPQLVAGPILRFSDIDGALARLTTFKLTAHFMSRGIGYIVLGLAVKVLIADTLGHMIEDYAVDPGAITPLSAWFTVFAYSFQIYFDFYGYSLVAIGLGSLFGFSFPKNFDRPYNALNPRDFWRQWHMTLSFWIRDYLYIPLGGNRSYVRNILIVMALCGLWHGAGWSFIVWGLYHAMLVIGYHAGRTTWDKFPALVQIAVTFFLVSLGWILFLFDFAQAAAFVQSLVGHGANGIVGPTLVMWSFLGLAAVVAFGIRLEPLAENNHTGIWASSILQILLAVLFVSTLFFLDRSETFIYFRF